MKFQNPSLNFFLNGRTNAHTDTRTSRKQYAPHVFKVGGIKTVDFSECIAACDLKVGTCRQLIELMMVSIEGQGHFCPAKALIANL